MMEVVVNAGIAVVLCVALAAVRRLHEAGQADPRRLDRGRAPASTGNAVDHAPGETAAKAGAYPYERRRAVRPAAAVAPAAVPPQFEGRPPFQPAPVLAVRRAYGLLPVDRSSSASRSRSTRS
jgi:hypothetical protein